MIDDKEFAIGLAKQAGEIIKKYFFIDHKKELKDDLTPVTIADKTINNLVVEKIKKQYPGCGYIGEEGGSFDEKNEYVWVCDPLDGTIPFTSGITACSFSLALLKEGRPILGVIYNPFTERLYFAEKNQGAYLNNKSIRVNKTKNLSGSYLGICVWKAAHYDFIKTFMELIRQGIYFQTGSTAYLGALVASGDFVANLFPHKAPWDFAAQKIIVEEASGKVTDIFGQDQRYDRKTKGGVASNGLLHDQLIEIIQKNL
jgi:fructose-1,6-bisphosphatase/inositol monophosphatase family enzyme